MKINGKPEVSGLLCYLQRGCQWESSGTEHIALTSSECRVRDDGRSEAGSGMTVTAVDERTAV